MTGVRGCPAPLMAALILAGLVPSPRQGRRRARAWVSAPCPARGAWYVGGRAGGWALTSHRAASLCLSSVDLITSSPQGLRGLVGWVHGHAASCGALPSLQRTLSSEYCGVIRAVWGCDQGHDYTMDADPSCRALLLDSTLAVKWTWDKEVVPRLTQHRASSPVGAAPQSSWGRASAAEAETETLPGVDTAHPPADGRLAAPEPGPLPPPGLPPSGAAGRRLLWPVGLGFPVPS